MTTENNRNLRSFWIIASAALLVISFCCAAVPEDPTVITGNQTSFDEALKENEVVLAFFYSPWSFFSQVFMGVYAVAAVRLKLHDPPIKCFAINGAEETNLTSRYSIEDYPTLKLFVDGIMVVDTFEGGHSPNEVVNWVNNHIDRDHALSNRESVENFLHDPRPEGEDVSVLGLFYPEKDVPSLRAFRHVSAMHMTVLFGHVNDKHEDLIQFLKDHYKITVQVPSVVLFKPFDERIAIFPAGGAVDQEHLESFILAHKLPKISEFSVQRSRRLFTDGRPIALLILGADATVNPNYEKEFAKARDLHKQSSPIFVTTHTEQQFERRLTEMIGAESLEQLPAMFVIRVNPVSSGSYYPALKWMCKSCITAEEMVRFISSVEDDTAEHYYKSEPELSPDNLYNGYVLQIVGWTFKKFVLENTKTVFLKFEAPWCGHCRKMETEWKRLARIVRKVPEIVIAKIDGTRNEVPNLHISAFPTLLLFKPGKSNEPLDYNGNRNAEGWIRWLVNNDALPKNFKIENESDEGVEDVGDLLSDGDGQDIEVEL